MQSMGCTLLMTAISALVAMPAQAQPGAAQGVQSAEGLRRGLEGVFRAAGQSQSNGPSSPIIDAETAKGMSYDNQVKATNTYFQKRQLNRMYKSEESGSRATAADHSRWASEKAPERLNGSQFDNSAGRINWPVVLRGNEYTANRESLDALYARHISGGGGLNTPEYAEIQRLCKAMQTQLHGNVQSITSEQYTYTRKFLDGLAYEARQPARG